MHGFLSFFFLVLATIGLLLCRRATKTQTSPKPALIMAVSAGILGGIFAVLDPHRIMAYLMFTAAFFGVGGSILWAIIRFIMTRKFSRTILVTMALCLVTLIAFGCALPDSTPPDSTQVGQDSGQNDSLPQNPAIPPGDDTALEPTDPEPTPEPGTGDNDDQASQEPGGQTGSGGQDTPSPTTPTTPTAPSPGTTSGQVKVHFIDVGQGDSILVQAPGKILLIDGGTRNAGTTVVNYLKKLGVTTIDYVIATHPHEDHIGGLISVLNNFTVHNVIDSGVPHTTKTYEDFLTLIDQKDINFYEGRAGQTHDLGGGAELKILHPHSPSEKHLNNASVVTRLTYGKTSFLFAGDAESAAEAEMLSRGGTLASTVLKVGHHGSSTSTTQNFLNAVKPQMAVITVGKNSYGHPTDQTLKRLHDAKAQIFRTDVHGTIIMTSDGNKVTVNKSAWSYTAPTPAPAPSPAPTPTPPPPADDGGSEEGLYVGSVKSDKYHFPTCRFAQNILKENEIWFKSVLEALQKQYSPCGTCKPPSN